MRNIAVLGTGSDVGKSIIAAGICRSLADRGFRVAPFKAQNMSNNSGITPEGLEMGRAQIAQAEAAGIVPHVDMNPVLLKPTGEKWSQVVLNGVVYEDSRAEDYHKNKEFYFEKACQAFDRLDQRFDRIVLEGAGSCAEVNLMDNDIVNFPIADYANADVVLVADIHRGGVFAQIIGTLECLPEKYRNMIKGFIINRFRGDIKLFEDGVDWLEKRTDKKVFGVLPWFFDFRIDAEDSVEIEEIRRPESLEPRNPRIGVIRLPHISNFTDFHALSKVEGLEILFIDTPDKLSFFDAVIIPGSKNTRADLEWLKLRFGSRMADYHNSGGNILGICGGYQVLGRYVDDPQGLEGIPGKTRGLGLLPVETVLKSHKTTTLSDFVWEGINGRGYEIHMGHTRLLSGKSLLRIVSRNSDPCNEYDGCMSDSGRIIGTYIHGFFDSPGVVSKWLKKTGISGIRIPSEMESFKERAYISLKEHFEKHVDLDGILA